MWGGRSHLGGLPRLKSWRQRCWEARRGRTGCWGARESDSRQLEKLARSRKGGGWWCGLEVRPRAGAIRQLATSTGAVRDLETESTDRTELCEVQRHQGRGPGPQHLGPRALGGGVRVPLGRASLGIVRGPVKTRPLPCQCTWACGVTGAHDRPHMHRHACAQVHVWAQH